jgi:hypothetical protein
MPTGREKFHRPVQRRNSIAATIRVLVLLALGLAGGAALARADSQDDVNVVVNGDLTRGFGNSPDSWRTAAWKLESARFTWHHDPNATPELEISSTEPNDAYWGQTVHLNAGWYHFTASLRAEGIPLDNVGANLSILEDGIISPQLHGTTDWQTVGFYLKAGDSGADVLLACRLGGFASTNRGKMSCRNIRAVPLSQAPTSASFTYDLDAIRGPAAPASAAAPPSTGAHVNLTLILIGVAALFLAGLLGGRGLAADTIRRLRGARGRPRRSVARGVVRPDSEHAGALTEEEPAEDLEREDDLLPEDLSTDQIRSYAWIGVAVALLWVTMMAIDRMEGTPYSVHFMPAFAGIRRLISTTGVAAFKLWSVWALGTVVVAGLLLQIDPALELIDAILAGAGGVWVLGYFLGQTLGPIDLFRPLTFWLLLAAGIFQLWRRPPQIRRAPLSAGQKLTLLAFGLLSIGMLPMELGSPVAPYMDVLGAPASVQRILTFGVYHPFDNDAFGCFGARAQTPGFELFLAMLASAGRVKLGVLAQSGTMIPMGALMLFAAYRLGLTLAGDTAGGVAALFLFFTVTFRRMAGMRGTAVDLVLIGLGLAFFLDRRRNRTLTAVGALILGTSVAVHAIDGGLAMMIAGVGALLCLAEADYDRFLASVICLAGAALFALPEFAIGLAKPLPYPVLPLAQLAGLAVILYGVRRPRLGAPPSFRSLPGLNPVAVAVLAATVIYIHATHPDSIYGTMMIQFPFLFLLAFSGLAIWIALDRPLATPYGATLVAIALLVGATNEFLGFFGNLAGSEVFRSGLADISYKIEEYWCPYFLVFPAAIPFALLYDAKRRTRPLVVLALLTLLIYPWHPWQDVSYDYTAHSITEEWAIGLNTAANGFWAGSHDTKWTMDADDFALVDFLRKEQASGRITTDTHILHIAHDATVLSDFNRYAVFTGIDDDPIVYEIGGADIGWFAGSRVRPIYSLRQDLAARPPYILEQVSPPAFMKEPPDGYDEVFHRGSLRLFRRKVS